MCDLTSDAEIVADVLRGNVDAFELLVRRYRQPLWRLAINRTGQVDEADDIVQEAFLSAYKSLHTYKSAYNFRTWLWTIVINQCRRHGSRNAKLPQQWSEHSKDAQLLACGSVVPSPESQLLQSEQGQLLRSILEDLPETRADAVRLRFFGSLKYQEIAHAMDCSLSASKKWVREGLQLMGEKLEQQEVN